MSTWNASTCILLHMEFRVYDTPWTADWLAHATREDTHRWHTGWYSMYRIQEQRAFGKALELLSLSPHPPPPHAPASWKWTLVCDNTFCGFDSQVFGLQLLPQRGGLCLYIFVLVCLLFFFFFFVKKKKKEKKRKQTYYSIKVLLNIQRLLCVVSVLRTGLSGLLLLFCLGWGKGSPPRVSLPGACLHVSLCSPHPPTPSPSAFLGR